jgi:ATP-dependent DNA helicase RecG
VANGSRSTPAGSGLTPKPPLTLADLAALDVGVLKGAGPKRVEALAGLEIRTVLDLVMHYPRRYLDRTNEATIDQLVAGDEASVLVTVSGSEGRRVRGGRSMVTAEVRDRTGRLRLSFFNQPWRERQLRPGLEAVVHGKVELFRGQRQMTNPVVDLVGDRTGRIIAVYPQSERSGITSWDLAKLVAEALRRSAGRGIDDPVPAGLRHEQGLVDRQEALHGIHAPDTMHDVGRARRRLVFDELLRLQLSLVLRKRALEATESGVAHRTDGPLVRQFLQRLPFGLTGAQARAIDEIGRDLQRRSPMHRLLQGDVGAGKTVVAVWSMLCAVDRGRQAALMVPTEVLAEQHHRTLQELLGPLGVNVLDGLRVELLTSSTTASARRRILGELTAGTVDLVVGTHALLEEGVRFADLGVVVIDEQHRFGVSQRVRLKEKASEAQPGDRAVLPDVLVMTATPIPRSLALTLYGDLDVTVLDELPPGREPVTTQLITPTQADRRARLYAFVREQAAAGFGTYVVCPFVEPSETLPGTSAIDEHRRLAEEVFPDLEVALVHGRMRSDDKDRAMARFRAREAQVLVATTVIEVGVDVPHATVMVVEDAERFGISQLHQLRGRVGRGGGRSYCVLFAGWKGELTDDADQRLQAVARTSDGFALAEADLAIRGEGQLFGSKQSGTPDLKLARIQTDLDLIDRTRRLAREVVAGDPHLSSAHHRAVRAEVERRYEDHGTSLAALETG